MDWFDRFFGARPQARFTVALGLVNGGCCYGPHCRTGDGKEELFCILGVWQTDKEGMPEFTRDMLKTVVHEFCHSYANPVIDRHEAELKAAGEKMFPHVAAAMRRQAYDNWKTMFYESLVRASTLRYVRQYDGAMAAWLATQEEKARGFPWIEDLSALLGEYEAHRDRYPTLESFSPRLVAFFNEYADKQAAAGRQATEGRLDEPGQRADRRRSGAGEDRSRLRPSDAGRLVVDGRRRPALPGDDGQAELRCQADDMVGAGEAEAGVGVPVHAQLRPLPRLPERGGHALGAVERQLYDREGGERENGRGERTGNSVVERNAARCPILPWQLLPVLRTPRPVSRAVTVPYSRWLIGLPTLPLPLHVLADLGVGQELFERVVVPPQLLLVGHQVMDRVVARLADLDPLVHLLPRVPLLKPLVAVQGPGDEVVEVVGRLRLAELADGVLHSLSS